MNNERIRLIHRLFSAWNRADVLGVLACYDKEFIREDLGSHKKYGHEQLEKVVSEYLTAFPGIHYQIDKLIEQDNNITVCWRATGHHKGKLMGIPATGKLINFTGVSILEIEHNAIQKAWYMWDEAGMLRQMGMLTEARFDSSIRSENIDYIQQPGQRA